MKNIALAAAIALALFSTAGIAQDRVTKTETTTIRTDTGGVTETHTEITTVVHEYVTYLRKVYISVGVPEDVIVRVIRLDIEIFEARVRFDFARVRTLVREETTILTPAIAQKVVTYVHENAPPAILPVYARPIWTQNVTINNNNVDVNINEQEVRSAVQKANININQVQQATQNVDLKTGEVKAGAKASADTSANTNQEETNTNSDNQTPGAKASPAPGQKPDTDTAKPDENEKGKTTAPGMTEKKSPDVGETPANETNPASKENATPDETQPAPDKIHNTPETGSSTSSPSPSSDNKTLKSPSPGKTPSAGSSSDSGLKSSPGMSSDSSDSASPQTHGNSPSAPSPSGLSKPDSGSASSPSDDSQGASHRRERRQDKDK